MAAIPQTLLDQYGHWIGRIPPDVLDALTVEQIAGRLRRAQARWDAALAADGDGDGNMVAAMEDAEAILAAPAPGGNKPAGPSALKAAGITTPVLEANPLIGRIPDGILAKMDTGQAVARAQVAAQLSKAGDHAGAQRVLTADAHVVHTTPMDQAAADAVRRGVREDLARAYGRQIRHVPDAVLAKLDAAELADRCEHAAALEKRGQAYPTGELIHGYLERARQVLAALPAADVAAEARRLEKAAMTVDEPVLARGYAERARALRLVNPQAPAVARPGLLGKAVQPTPAQPPRVLHKAAPPSRRSRRRPSLSKASAVRLGEGLDLLEQTLLELRGWRLNKAEGAAPDGVFDLLDRAAEHF